MPFQTDRAYLDVTFNDVNLNIGADLLDSIWIIQNTHTNKPSVSLRFVDNKQAAGSYGLYQDGGIVKATVGDGRNTPVTYQFRQFGLEEGSPKAAGDLVELSGVADVMQWFTSTVSGPQKGNASDVITQLAQANGISKVDVDGTQDKMTWHADNRSVAQFARVVMDHAYMGDGKSPLMALTADAGEWMLRVKDIMTSGSAVKTLISAGLDGAGSDGPMIYDHRVKTQGGALNSFANYGLKLVTDDLAGQIQQLLNLNITSLTRFPGVSSALSSLIGNARTIYAPASIGNTHDKYHDAQHANTKSRAMFTTSVNTLVQEQTGLKLLDDVQHILANSAGMLDDAFSGLYKVASHTAGITRGTYVERIGSTAQGQNASTGSSS